MKTAPVCGLVFGLISFLSSAGVHAAPPANSTIAKPRIPLVRNKDVVTKRTNAVKHPEVVAATPGKGSQNRTVQLLSDGTVTVQSGDQTQTKAPHYGNLGVGIGGGKADDAVGWKKRPLPNDGPTRQWLEQHNAALLELLRTQVSETQVNDYVRTAESGKSLDEVIQMRTELLTRILKP